MGRGGIWVPAMAARSALHAVVRRDFAAPAERVFEAWLKPERLEQWMFGPAVRDAEIVHLALDPRVGGAFSFLVEREGAPVEHVGKYLELAAPQRLAFTWMVADATLGSRVTIDIVERGEDGCALTLTQELHPSWASHVDAIASSWAHMLGVLARLLEGEARAGR